MRTLESPSGALAVAFAGATFCAGWFGAPVTGGVAEAEGAAEAELGAGAAFCIGVGATLGVDETAETDTDFSKHPEVARHALRNLCALRFANCRGTCRLRPDEMERLHASAVTERLAVHSQRGVLHLP